MFQITAMGFIVDFWVPRLRIWPRALARPRIATTLETDQTEDRAPWLSWHTLRRTHPTSLQASGASLRDVQVQLGHSKMSTTLEIYTVSIPAHLRVEVENLSQWMTNGDEFGPTAQGLPTTIQQNLGG